MLTSRRDRDVERRWLDSEGRFRARFERVGYPPSEMKELTNTFQFQTPPPSPLAED
jgi:hypothetical protein